MNNLRFSVSLLWMAIACLTYSGAQAQVPSVRQTTVRPMTAPSPATTRPVTAKALLVDWSAWIPASNTPGLQVRQRRLTHTLEVEVQSTAYVQCDIQASACDDGFSQGAQSVRLLPNKPVKLSFPNPGLCSNGFWWQYSNYQELGLWTGWNEGENIKARMRMAVKNDQEVIEVEVNYYKDHIVTFQGEQITESSMRIEVAATACSYAQIEENGFLGASVPRHGAMILTFPNPGGCTQGFWWKYRPSTKPTLILFGNR